MCGIAGILARDGSTPSERVLRSFEDALAHRGPDGKGRYLKNGLAMVQTRLAIIDLVSGDQPLYGPSGTALVANGEIYNYLELRRGFAGARFVTQSDCEMPLHVYETRGSEFTRALRGMYAIALYDPGRDALFLARDPFGIKPLYYAETPDGLAFASEPQALLRSGVVKRGIRPETAAELLQLQFTTGRRTIFEDISRVLPGETLEAHAGRIANRSTVQALPDGPQRAGSEEGALQLLDKVLMESVVLHQRADVPYGMFLSGGVDSSALLAAMARLNERPVRAFTAGFPGTEVRDERAHAARVAKAAGAEHIEIAITERDFWEELPAIAACMDDPAADYAIVPTYLMARTAARELKVVLCGEGGDELFAGYGRYRAVRRPRLLGGKPMRRRGLLDGLGLLRSENARWRDGMAASERAAVGHGWSKLQAAQATDCADWLPHDLLLKLDRCLMAHGVEGRTPFLDPMVAEFAFRLPDDLKLRRGVGKFLLRRWLENVLPAADPFSRKRGFTVPVANWIARRAGDLAPLVARAPGIEELCRRDAVEKLFFQFARRMSRREGAACWQLLFYALWHRVHGEGRIPRGDVFAVLEAK